MTDEVGRPATPEETRKFLGDVLYHSIVSMQKLSAYLKANPGDFEEFDLNPHLHIEWIADTIAKEVNAEYPGIGSTKEAVMLLWLTHLVTKSGVLEA